MLFMFLVTAIPAWAAVWTLPGDLEIIEEEAFAGNTHMGILTLPDSLKRIERNAFADTVIEELFLSDGLEFISPDAFTRAQIGKVTANPGTYAFTWAMENGYIQIEHVAVTLTANEQAVQTGDPVTWTAHTAVENPEFRYRWSVSLNGQFLFAVVTSEPDFTYAPAKPGTWDVAVSIEYSYAEGSSEAVSAAVTERTQETAASDFTYQAMDDVHVKITGYTGTETHVVVPETIDGFTVQRIDSNAFRRNRSIVSIHLPDSVRDIGGYAFQECTALQAVGFGEGLETIEDYAFTSCSEVKVLHLPDSLTHVGLSAFAGMTSLISADLPDGVTYIGRYAYQNCTSLTSFHYPLNLAGVGGDRIFSNCQALESITVPEGVTILPGNMFNGAGYLKEVHLPSTLKTIGDSAFRGCSSITELNIPDGVERIEANAFYGMTSLISADLPDGVTYIGRYAYQNCTSLTSFHYPLNLAGVGGDRIFSNCQALESITVPEGVTILPGNMFNGAGYLKEVHLPSTLKTIGDSAFRGCSSITELNIPDGVERIEANAFYGMTSLISADLPDGVTYIGHYAYQDCTSLTSFHFPVSLTRVGGDRIFFNCQALESVTVTEGATVIPEKMFSGAAYLKEIHLSSTVSTIGAYAFENCTGITELDIPEGLTRIENYAFSGMTGLVSAGLPDSVTYIGRYAFQNCTSLAFFHYPVNLASVGGEKIFNNCEALKIINVTEGVTVIPENLFNGATFLQEVHLPSTLKTIGFKAFYGCTGITELEIPEGLETVDDYVFYGMTGLVNADLPDSVTVIGRSAFENCEALTSFHYPMNLATVNGAKMLAGCTSLESVTVPEGVVQLPSNTFWDAASLRVVNLPSTLKSIGEYAFYGCAGITELDMPETLENVGHYAFYGMTGLVSSDLPDSVTFIGRSAYENCEALTSFHYPLNLASVGGEKILAGCASLETVVVPEGVTALPDSVFRGANCLKEIQLPSTLTAIGANAFYGCSSVTELTIQEGLETAGNYAFYGMTSLTSADLPDSVTFIGNNAYENCTSLTSFHYPLNLASVGGGSIFANCPMLESITVPEGVTILPENVFRGSTYLKLVDLPSTMVKIGNNAFNGCTSITQVVIRDGLQEVGVAAFYGMTNLISADLPDTVTRIGDNAFQDCTSLTSFHYPLSLQDVYNGYFTYGNLFVNCVSLKEIRVPEGVTQLPFCVFRGSKHLEHVYLPSTLESIGDFAFYECESIVNLDIPAGVTKIGGYAFAYMKQLTTADLPDGVTSIGECAYAGCENLTYFHYPRNLEKTTPFNYTCGDIFSNCYKLETITIPDGVTHIPGSMFFGAEYLKNVDIPLSVTEIGYPVPINNRDPFHNCKSIEVLYLSPNITRIYDPTFEGCTSLEIWTEYGCYALEYAKSHGIPYYYLTPVRATVPTGTLYRGDPFVIDGFARSSLPLTEVSATIWDSNGNAVRSVTLNPGYTDLDLAGGFSRALHIDELPLGSYRFTMHAATEKSEESWYDTSFQIVPPPLRIYLQDAHLPEDVIDISSGWTVSGTIISNYEISNVTAEITKLDGTQIRYASASPGSLNYDISGLSGTLNIAGLVAGEYELTLHATANGETRMLAGTAFEPFNLSGVVGDEEATKIVKFASIGKNRSAFDGGYTAEAMSSFSTGDMILMAINTRTKWILDPSGIPNALHEYFNIPMPEIPSERMVDLYENELASMIAEMNTGGISIPIPQMDHTQKFIYDCAKDGTEMMTHIFQQMTLDKMTDVMMKNDSRQFYKDKIESAFKEYDDKVTKLKSVVEGFNIASDYAESVSLVYCNYIKGMYIIASIADAVNESDNAEMQLAVSKLGSKYKSLTANVVISGLDQIYEWVKNEAFGELTKAFFEQVSGVSFSGAGDLYTLINLCIDVTMEVSGLADVAEGHEDFITQLDCFHAAKNSYLAAFDAVYEGDHSNLALNRLAASFALTKTACIKVHQTMLTMDWIPMGYSDPEQAAKVNDYIARIEALNMN